MLDDVVKHLARTCGAKICFLERRVGAGDDGKASKQEPGCHRGQKVVFPGKFVRLDNQLTITGSRG